MAGLVMSGLADRVRVGASDAENAFCASCR